MKTHLFGAAVRVAAFSMAVFIAAGMAAQPGRSAESPSTVPQATAPALIDEAKASEIALGQAGGGEVVDMRLKRKRHGAPVYSALVINGGSRIEVKIDATTGTVMEFDREIIETVERSRRLPADPAARETAVTFDRAKEIALERAGGGTIVEVKKEFKKRGRVIYEVEVVDAGRKCEMDIDAQTGNVIEYKEKHSRF